MLIILINAQEKKAKHLMFVLLLDQDKMCHESSEQLSRLQLTAMDGQSNNCLQWITLLALQHGQMSLSTGMLLNTLPKTVNYLNGQKASEVTPIMIIVKGHKSQ